MTYWLISKGVQSMLFKIETEVQGYFYHLGLSQRYNQEEEFALHIRMLPALAFLPTGDVIEGFEELVDTIRIL